MTPGGATRKCANNVFPGRRGRTLVNTLWFPRSSPMLSSNLSLSCILCFLLIYFLAAPCGTCRISGPWPGIKLVPWAVDSDSSLRPLDHQGTPHVLYALKQLFFELTEMRRDFTTQWAPNWMADGRSKCRLRTGLELLWVALWSCAALRWQRSHSWGSVNAHWRKLLSGKVPL